MSVFLTFLNKKPPRKDGIPLFPVWVTMRRPSPSLRVCTDVRTDQRTDGLSYADVITKFSRFEGLPIFLTHGASLGFARWSSANNKIRKSWSSFLFCNIVVWSSTFCPVRKPYLYLQNPRWRNSRNYRKFCVPFARDVGFSLLTERELTWILENAIMAAGRRSYDTVPCLPLSKRTAVHVFVYLAKLRAAAPR